MRRMLAVLFMVATSAAAVVAEDRSILLVTAKGVWQSDVVNGVPGPFVAKPYDVVIQGIGVPAPPGDDPPVDDPPASDPIVKQIATISSATLKDKAEGTAVAALVDTLSKFGLSGATFKEALVMAAPIADTSMQADGRINKWVKDALAVTADPAKLRAGLIAAFDIAPATLETIRNASLAEEGAAVPAEALDWAQIISIIQLVIQLLRNLGIIPA